MEVLLREVREGPDGIPEYHDTEISAAELTIGSAADRSIQLLGKGVDAEQAVIRKSGSRLELSCKRGKVTVNERDVASALLCVGDIVRIGDHELTVMTAPGGFDAAIELRPAQNIDASEYENAFRTDLHQTWMGKRPAAWLAVALVLIVGLAIPFVTVMMHRADQPVPALMPSDKLWISGPLSAAHQQATGNRCDSCHQQLFQHVQDKACLTCHETIHDHITPEHLGMTQLGPNQRCATCHREHNEPETYLVNSGDALCVDCHANSKQKFGKLSVAPVTGFSHEHHPAFKANLLKPKTTTVAGAGVTFDWITEIRTVETASEQSNLKFSHAQHLDPDRVLRLGDSKPLSCVDCHRMEPDGEHFEPVTMESRCAACHELTFDPAAPDRQLPHGKPREAILTLQDYFTRKFSDPNAGRPTVQRRRLPGHDEEEQTCNGAPFDCAMRSARAEIENQFSRRGCIGCHVVVDTHSETLLDRFQVYPIKLARDYFPAGRFDHRNHQIQGKLTGDAACLSCHKARQSKESSDLLLPVMAKCEECHGDKPAVERVVVQCVSCHAYHSMSNRLVLSGEVEKE